MLRVWVSYFYKFVYVYGSCELLCVVCEVTSWEVRGIVVGVIGMEWNEMLE